jgi:cytochrome c-type biogenesis protein CcmH/NrfG
LSVDYSPSVIPIAFGWNAANLLGLVAVLGVLGLAFFSWRQGPMGPHRLNPRALAWGVVWFVITISPTSNLLFLSGILLAERTLYLPSVGFVAAAAWALLRLWEVRPRLATLVVLLALGFGTVRTWTRTPTWKNNLEVFHTLTSEHPEAGRSQWILGDTYFGMGRMSEGLHAYRNALGMVGDSYNMLVSVSRNLIREGYLRPAELLLKRAWEQRPEYGVAPGLLSLIYHDQGRYEEAVEAARYSIAEDSTDASKHHVLARSLQALGRLDEAVKAREGAIQNGESQHLEQWVWLAELHLQREDTTRALMALDSARLRVNTDREVRQFDSILSAMGYGG